MPQDSFFLIQGCFHRKQALLKENMVLLVECRALMVGVLAVNTHIECSHRTENVHVEQCCGSCKRRRSVECRPLLIQNQAFLTEYRVFLQTIGYFDRIYRFCGRQSMEFKVCCVNHILQLLYSKHNLSLLIEHSVYSI